MKSVFLFGIVLSYYVLSVYCSLNRTEEAVCKSDAECGTEECCVGFDRRRFIFPHSDTGYCRPLRYQGHACHVFLIQDPFNPNLHVNYCPCATGLECRGTRVDNATSSNVVHHDPKCLPVEA